MKKSLFTACLLASVIFFLTGGISRAEDSAVLQTKEKEALLIDDSKMQDTGDMPSEKEIKKAKKEEEKLNKEKIKQQEEDLKAEIKEQKRIEKEKIKEEKEALKKMNETPQNNETVEENKPEEEAKDINVESPKEENKTPVEEKSSEVEIKDEPVKNEPVSAEDKIEAGTEDKAEDKPAVDDNVKEDNIKEAEPQPVKDTPADEVKEEAGSEPDTPQEKAGEIIQKESTAPLYRNNLTYEDIDKNSVSINEFLQFTDKQNEKFSLFYYKTTSKLNDYTKQIKYKEQEIEAVRKTKLSAKAQLSKINKIENEIMYIYGIRDEYYNKSLKKFNSMLTKKQAMKWEILQEMGYRFFPNFD